MDASVSGSTRCAHVHAVVYSKLSPAQWRLGPKNLSHRKYRRRLACCKPLTAQLEQKINTAKPPRISSFRPGAIHSWTSPDGLWKVRPIRDHEVKPVSILQAEAFYKPKGVPMLDGFLQQAFQGEVWAILNSKLQTASSNGFCCLVAESATQPDGIVGVVEVSIQSEHDEMEALSKQGLEETGYAYLTSMAVSKAWRRKGIASALLSAAERVAGKWWQNWVLLHVYDTDAAGNGLYQRNGYARVMRDPPWQALWGGRVRVLMAKNASMFASSSPLTSISSISSSLMQMWQRDL